MADVADVTHQSAAILPAASVAPLTPVAPVTNEPEIVFRGSPRNMAVGTTLLLAAALAFVMGMTEVFFARALAWTFVIWGILFLLGDLLDWTRSWMVSEKGLRIGINTPLWQPHKLWEWEYINRVDLVVKRYEPKVADIVMQVYYTAPGDSVLAREDRVLSPELARLIIERANLKATHANNPKSFSALPPAKTTYVWNKSGKFNTAM